MSAIDDSPKSITQGSHLTRSSDISGEDCLVEVGNLKEEAILGMKVLSHLKTSRGITIWVAGAYLQAFMC